VVDGGRAVEAQDSESALEGAPHQRNAVELAQVGGGFVAAARQVQPGHAVNVEHARRLS
jgi:hypothetical protein